MFLAVSASVPGGFALQVRALLDAMSFSRTRSGIPANGVRMGVSRPIHPCPAPRRIVDNDSVLGPDKAVGTPTPGLPNSAQRHAETKPDRTADEDSSPRWGKHDQWVVVWNNDVARVHRQDFNVRPSPDDDLRTRPQIPVPDGRLAHSLDGIHDVIGLGQERAADFLGPRH